MSTKIEWADETVNPFTGCLKVSPGCDNCYALKMAWRLSHNPNHNIADKYKGTVEKKDGKIRWTGQINKDLQSMERLFTGRKGKTIFVGSMGDIAHPNVNFDLFAQIIDKCYSINNHRIHYSEDKKEAHTFLFLTKRPSRFAALWEMYFKSNDIKENWNKWEQWPLHDSVYSTFHIGTTVENQEQANKRIPFLLLIPAAKRFVSVEPILGIVELDSIEYPPNDFTNALSLEEWTDSKDSPEVKNNMGTGNLLDYVICGGESGSGARPVHPEWLRSLRNQCQAYNVPFFFKQWGEWIPVEDAILRGKEFVELISNKRTHIFEDGIRMIRVGKKHTGKMLDRKEHDFS